MEVISRDADSDKFIVAMSRREMVALDEFLHQFSGEEHNSTSDDMVAGLAYAMDAIRLLKSQDRILKLLDENNALRSRN